MHFAAANQLINECADECADYWANKVNPDGGQRAAASEHGWGQAARGIHAAARQRIRKESRDNDDKANRQSAFRAIEAFVGRRTHTDIHQEECQGDFQHDCLEIANFRCSRAKVSRHHFL